MECGRRDQAFAHQFRCSHHVCWVHSLVRAGEDKTLDAVLGCRLYDILHAKNICLNRFEGRSFANVDMLVGSGVKQNVYFARLAEQQFISAAPIPFPVTVD